VGLDFLLNLITNVWLSSNSKKKEEEEEEEEEVMKQAFYKLENARITTSVR